MVEQLKYLEKLAQMDTKNGHKTFESLNRVLDCSGMQFNRI